jgi:RNA polymerase sigma-70 factor (ECF subfamily)
VQIAWRSGGSVADTDTTTGDDRSQAQASTAGAERAARIAAADLATVELAQADPRAFAPLYTRYAPIVLNYCRRRIADPDAAADATSLIFIRALAGLPAFRPDPSQSGSTFRSWLFTIAHNVVIDTRRRHRPHVSLDRRMGATGEASSGEAGWPADPSASPEELAIRADDSERVQAMLRRLPERQRRVVELRIAGLTGPEIARALGMSTSAVKSAQFRAYGTLRDLLRAEFQHPPETDDAQR